MFSFLSLECYVQSKGVDAWRRITTIVDTIHQRIAPKTTYLRVISLVLRDGCYVLEVAVYLHISQIDVLQSGAWQGVRE